MKSENALLKSQIGKNTMSIEKGWNNLAELRHIMATNVTALEEENTSLNSTIQDALGSIKKLNSTTDWHFEYRLKSDLPENKEEAVKFTKEESTSYDSRANHPFDRFHGKAYIKEPGVYFFRASAKPFNEGFQYENFKFTRTVH